MAISWDSSSTLLAVLITFCAISYQLWLIHARKVNEKAAKIKQLQEQLLLFEQQKQQQSLELQQQRVVEQKRQTQRKQIEFDIMYTMRKVTHSDHNDVIALFSDVHSGTDLVCAQFAHFLNHSHDYLFYGCLHKASNQIIATVIFKIIDGGYTALLMGVRTHRDHRRKDIATNLSIYAMHEMQELYPCVERVRSTQQNSSESTTKFHAKLGFETLEHVRFAYCSSRFRPNQFRLFEQRLTDLHKKYTVEEETKMMYREYVSNFEELKCRDIDNVIRVLINYYNTTDVLVEDQIFDLQIDEHDEDDEEEEEEEEEEQEEDEDDIEADQSDQELNEQKLEKKEENELKAEEEEEEEVPRDAVVSDENEVAEFVHEREVESANNNEADACIEDQYHDEQQQIDLHLDDEAQIDQQQLIVLSPEPADVHMDDEPPVNEEESVSDIDIAMIRESRYIRSINAYRDSLNWNNENLVLLSEEEEEDENANDVYGDHEYEYECEHEYDETQIPEKSATAKSIQQFRSYLFDEMNAEHVQIYALNTDDRNQEDGALCIKWRNVEYRTHCTFYHVYGKLEIAIIAMMKKCYDLWSKEIRGEMKNSEETVEFYIDSQSVLQNERLKRLFANADYVCVNEMELDSDPDELEPEL